jgi:integrase
MAATNLTARAVENWKPDPTKRQEIPDTLVTGLYLVVTERGAKSWAVRYRHTGKPRKFTLGQYPALQLGEAREMAREALVKVAKGMDPAGEKAAASEAETAAREAAERAQRDRFEVVADLFFERYLKPNNRSADESKRVIDRILLPAWGTRSVHEITRRDVIELLDGIVDRGSPIMANRVLALVRKLFNWCIERGILEASPVSGIKAPGKEESRDRVLSDDELVEVMTAADSIGWPFGPVVKLLVLTAQRRDEVAGMRWADLDLDRAVWTIPASVAKNNKIHEVPLAPAAVAILKEMPRVGRGEFVFSTTGRTAVSGFSKAKEKVDSTILEARRKAAGKAAGEAGADLDTTHPLPHWTLHDLRRTAASGMARLNIPPHVVEKLLNHVSGTIKGVAAVYNRHEYYEERRRALEAWANKVESLTQPAGSNVVALRG